MEKEIVYNKLVRDNILNVIENTGKKYTYHIADEKVLAASISLWFINLVLPSIIGLFCMFHIDYTKK